MEKEKFNSTAYIFKMLIFTVIWLVLVYFILENIDNFPQKIYTMEYGIEGDKFSIDIRATIAILIALIAQYMLFTKGGLFSYSFATDCKNPILSLVLNILFGGIICLVLPTLIPFGNVETVFVAKTFLIMATINYLFFYSRYGAQFEEIKDVEDWHNTVHRLSNLKDK